MQALSRFKSYFIYAYGIWLFLPVILEKGIGNYPLFLLRGAFFALLLAIVFMGLNWLFTKIGRLR